MRNLLSTTSLFLGLAVGCFAQAVRLAPGIAVAEAEYRDAVSAWSRADPGLPKDLLRASPEEVRGRIHRVAALRDDAMVKRRTYLGELVKRLQKARDQMTGRVPDRIPAGELKRGLPDEQARIQDRQESVEILLRELPPGEQYATLQRHLENERARLGALRNDLAARSEALDALGRLQDSLDTEEIAGLASKMEAVVRVWELERDDVERQRANWKEVYAAMERAVDANAAAGKKMTEASKGGKKEKKKGSAPDARN